MITQQINKEIRWSLDQGLQSKVKKNTGAKQYFAREGQNKLVVITKQNTVEAHYNLRSIVKNTGAKQYFARKGQYKLVVITKQNTWKPTIIYEV